MRARMNVFRGFFLYLHRFSNYDDDMTAFTINIPNHEVSFFKKMISKMGWTYEVQDESVTKKARLYDPETGEYLNDKTMKAAICLCCARTLVKVTMTTL